MAGKNKIFFHGLIVLVMIFLVQHVSGCTFLENTRGSGNTGITVSEMDRAVESVRVRTVELATLEETARNRDPENLGRARAVLGEMAHFRDENNPAEVMRLDSVMDGILESIRSAVDVPDEAPAENVSQLEEQNRILQTQVSRLESRNVDLERDLTAHREICDIQNGILANRLDAALKSRDDAVREVVRTRSRIEGMASEAEASAMFAEARVLVDRMVEDAFNDRALGELQQARSYLDSGKKELDEGNSGGAAYLFDLVSSLYEGFKVSDPRKVTVSAGNCILFSSPSTSSKRIRNLIQGEVVTGLEAANEWIRVATTSGRKGWIRKDQVH